MNVMNMKISLEFKPYQFYEDFLQIEAKHNLAIYGDDLLLRLKEPYREDAKQYGKIFTRDILYNIKCFTNKIKLVGIHM